MERLGAVPPRLAKVRRIGMKITTTGVLLSTPLISSTANMDRVSATPVRPPAAPSSARAPWSSAPVCASPCPMTISPRRASSAGLAKPASRSVGPSLFRPSAPASGKMWNASSSRQITASDASSIDTLGAV